MSKFKVEKYRVVQLQQFSFRVEYSDGNIWLPVDYYSNRKMALYRLGDLEIYGIEGRVIAEIEVNRGGLKC